MITQARERGGNVQAFGSARPSPRLLVAGFEARGE